MCVQTLTLTVVDRAPVVAFVGSITATKNAAISPFAPVSTGGLVVVWAISPSLPSGLSFSTTSGTITGTPIVLFSTSSFTVSFSNTGGSGSVSLDITVNDVAPSFSYSNSDATYTINSIISSNIPTTAGGTVVSWSITPTLVTGLQFSMGVISGTPTVEQTRTSYTVTATNSGGSYSVVIFITVTAVAPSSLSYENTNALYLVNLDIPANSPIIPTDTRIDSYSVSPSLPSGLSINGVSGVITGRPSSITAALSYVVTASNTGGSLTVSLRIEVVDAPPYSLVYSANPALYIINVAITNNTASNLGGAVVSYSISPALPTGLSFNTATGTISGTPTVRTGQSNYIVTAINSGVS